VNLPLLQQMVAALEEKQELSWDELRSIAEVFDDRNHVDAQQQTPR
jgi:hypothetical protein